MHNVSTAAFNGINPGSDLVADGILNINYADPSKIPAICGGIVEVGGSFQSIINTQIKAQGCCSQPVPTSKGVSSSPPLTSLGSRIAGILPRCRSSKHARSPRDTAHPGDAGTAFNGIDMQIDGQVPGQDSEDGPIRDCLHQEQRTGGLLRRDDATTRDDAVLDWEVDGPTGWTGEDISAPEHIRSDAAFDDFL